MTTFITPFGRSLCNRLPFGISSAPEIFQREMQVVLGELPGVVCQMDDILVFESNKSEHDKRLCVALEKLKKEEVTLNAEKCEFHRRTVKFLGHEIDKERIKADPDKVQAINSFDAPKNRKELQRFFWHGQLLG